MKKHERKTEKWKIDVLENEKYARGQIWCYMKMF